MHVVRVLPDVFAIDKSFDYIVPSELSDQVAVGSEVRIRLHGRRVSGWVIEDRVAPREDLRLQQLESLRGWGPPPSVVGIAQWAAWRWAGPTSGFLKSASSPRAVRDLPRTLRATAAEAAPSVRASQRRDPLDPARILSLGTVVVRHPPAADIDAFLQQASSLVGPSAPHDSGVLVLVPEHAAAQKVASRLREGGRKVALLPQDWAIARSGGCVVVGTRAAAFAPLPLLAGALVVDAHDEAYFEQRAPTWCAWQVVSERAKRDGAPCALVSPCPTLDLLRAGRLIVPSRLEERHGWPVLEVVDRRRDDPRTGLFSERVVSLVRWAAERRGRRVLCVLNRKGRVRLMACATCGELERCERCGSSVELARDEETEHMHCRRCGDERPVVCLRCGGGSMRAIRIGVSRAREELEALARADVEEVWGKPGEPEVAAGSAAGRAPVAVGTEALLHRTDGADAVVFLDFDAELLAPRMRASEEALALLARASRLVRGSSDIPATGGRSPGRVVVQTRLGGHEVLTAAVTADPCRVQRAEEEVRRSLGLPPFSALAVVSGAVADDYGSSLREAAPAGVEVSGPADGEWLVKAPSHEVLCDLLASVSRPRGRLRVAVDPVRV